MKHVILQALLLCIAILPATAQKQGQARIDSLLQEIKPTKSDTVQAKILLELSFAYNSIDPDKGISYGKEALVMSESLKWKVGMGDAYRAIGVSQGFGKSQFPEALESFTKSLEIAEETDDKADAARVLNNMGVIYWFLSDFPNAIDHYYKALKIHEEVGDKDEIAISLGNIGLVYNSQE